MARPTPLPDRLKYLQPFRKKFSPRPDELEIEGMKELVELFAKRIAGLPDDDAEKLLEEDVTALSKWLELPEQANDCLHYATGVFCIISGAEMVKTIREQSKTKKEPLPWVEMELWAKAKPRRFEKQRDGGLVVKWNSLMLTVGLAVDKSTALGNRPVAFHDPRNQVTATAVHFGEAKGTKYIEISENRFGRPHKRIIYVLTVLGGIVEVHIDFIGKQPKADWGEAKISEYAKFDNSKWDETRVESFFHTIRIVMREPR